MVVERINRLIRNMDMKEVKANLISPTRAETDPGVYICELSLEDWKRYVKSEQQALMSRAMAWINGKIYIVELPGGIHDNFLGSLDFAVLSATGTGDQHLRSRRSTYVENLEHIEPDSSFGPAPGFGATQPIRLTWLHESGDVKAIQWSQFPGVEYILLIRLSPNVQVRQYKLHSVAGGAKVPMVATPIINPTDVVLDSRHLLGLPALVPIPATFTAPNLTIDLFPLVQNIISAIQA